MIRSLRQQYLLLMILSVGYVGDLYPALVGGSGGSVANTLAYAAKQAAAQAGVSGSSIVPYKPQPSSVVPYKGQPTALELIRESQSGASSSTAVSPSALAGITNGFSNLMVHAAFVGAGNFAMTPQESAQVPANAEQAQDYAFIEQKVASDQTFVESLKMVAEGGRPSAEVENLEWFQNELAGQEASPVTVADIKNYMSNVIEQKVNVLINQIPSLLADNPITYTVKYQGADILGGFKFAPKLPDKMSASQGFALLAQYCASLASSPAAAVSALRHAINDWRPDMPASEQEVESFIGLIRQDTPSISECLARGLHKVSNALKAAGEQEANINNALWESFKQEYAQVTGRAVGKAFKTPTEITLLRAYVSVVYEAVASEVATYAARVRLSQKPGANFMARMFASNQSHHNAYFGFMGSIILGGFMGLEQLTKPTKQSIQDGIDAGYVIDRVEAYDANRPDISDDTKSAIATPAQLAEAYVKLTDEYVNVVSQSLTQAQKELTVNNDVRMAQEIVAATELVPVSSVSSDPSVLQVKIESLQDGIDKTKQTFEELKTNTGWYKKLGGYVIKIKNAFSDLSPEQKAMFPSIFKGKTYKPAEMLDNLEAFKASVKDSNFKAALSKITATLNPKDEKLSSLSASYIRYLVASAPKAASWGSYAVSAIGRGIQSVPGIQAAQNAYQFVYQKAVAELPKQAQLAIQTAGGLFLFHQIAKMARIIKNAKRAPAKQTEKELEVATQNLKDSIENSSMPEAVKEAVKEGIAQGVQEIIAQSDLPSKAATEVETDVAKSLGQVTQEPSEYDNGLDAIKALIIKIKTDNPNITTRALIEKVISDTPELAKSVTTKKELDNVTGQVAMLVHQTIGFDTPTKSQAVESVNQAVVAPVVAAAVASRATPSRTVPSRGRPRRR